MEKKIKLRGHILAHYVNEETKHRQINLESTPERNEGIIDYLTSCGFDWSGESCPAKVNDKDVCFIKTTSQYSIEIKGIPSGYTIDDIGPESDVTLYVKLKEGQYRKKKYVSAYLIGIEVHDFKERTIYNPFTDDEIMDEI